MKIALCLYGVVGNKKTKAGSKSSSLDVLELGYKYYQQNLFLHHETKVFAHSWSNEFRQEINDLYNPAYSIVEPQEAFYPPHHVRGDSEAQPRRVQNHYSRWRSTQKVLSMLEKSEEKFDFVVLSRFDVGILNPFNFENLDKSKIYASNWLGVRYDNSNDIFDDGRGLFYELKNKNKLKKVQKYHRGYPVNSEGLLDLWFIGSPEKIKVFKNLFDKIGDYMIPGNCPGAPYVSNHKLAQYHLKQENELKNLSFVSDPTEDHCLLRYKFFNASV
jgi:hypothetical protein